MTQRPQKILLVDDDPDVLLILKDNLELDGYIVQTASGGKEALKIFEGESPDLTVLDLTLPDVDGIQVCRLIREKSSAPIIMLSARDSVPDKVLGLETGADDYMAKPFDYLELAARIRVCLRRDANKSSASAIRSIGKIRVDLARQSVTKNGVKVPLTQREFNLFLFLAEYPGKVMRREEIRNELWPGSELYRDSRTIDVHIQRLRSKLEDDPANPRYIITVQGVGYMFDNATE